MTTLDRETIVEAARGAVDALRRHSEEATEAAPPGLRGEVERLMNTLQEQYGQTRTTARQEIAGFLSELGEIDPKLPGIVAETANEMTGRKGRAGLALLAVIVALVVGAVTLLWLRSPETYRSLVDAIGRSTRE